MNNRCNIKVTLLPIFYGDRFPTLKIGYNDVCQEVILKEETEFEFNIDIEQQEIDFFIELFGKKNSDSIGNKDLAVVIKSLKIMNIDNKKFIWAGTYLPDYPEPWHSQQLALGNKLMPMIKNVDRLGWNGRWVLNIKNPAFTWIHGLLDHGWIHPYDHFYK